MDKKLCGRCKVEKPVTEFYPSRGPKTGKHGVTGYCKRCMCESAIEWRRINKEKRSEYQKKWWKKNGRKWYAKYKKVHLERTRKAHYRRQYGITIEQYDELFKAQEGRCKICSQTVAERLCVDHCHSTGVVRSLLCKSCNVGIGRFNDNPDLLIAAANYLRDWLKSAHPSRDVRVQST